MHSVKFLWQLPRTSSLHSVLSGNAEDRTNSRLNWNRCSVRPSLTMLRTVQSAGDFCARALVLLPFSGLSTVKVAFVFGDIRSGLGTRKPGKRNRQDGQPAGDSLSDLCSSVVNQQHLRNSAKRNGFPVHLAPSGLSIASVRDPEKSVIERACIHREAQLHGVLLVRCVQTSSLPPLRAAHVHRSRNRSLRMGALSPKRHDGYATLLL